MIHNNFLLRCFLCSFLFLLIFSFNIYRIYDWFSTYGLLSSKLIISSYQEEDIEIDFPQFAICNLNPIKGSYVNEYQRSRSKSFDYKSGIDYEVFIDAFNGYFLNNHTNGAEILQEPILNLIEKSGHELKSMLKFCSIGQRFCSEANFTKVLMPFGMCYKFIEKINSQEEVRIVLDPEKTEYLIPNRGLVGFQIFIFSNGQPLLSNIPPKITVGQNFHSIIRIEGIHKIYLNDCLEEKYWTECINGCIDEIISKRCHCHFSGNRQETCSLQSLAQCQENMIDLINNIDVRECPCKKSCRSNEYSLNSIVQAIKSSLSQTSLYNSKSRKIFDLEYRRGLMIQTWAYLRELNRVAFEETRNLTLPLANFLSAMEKVENYASKLKFAKDATQLSLSMDGHKGSQASSTSDCLESNELSTRLEFLMNLLDKTLGSYRKSFFGSGQNNNMKNFHVCLVAWLFNENLSASLYNLTKTMVLNEVISDLTVLDHRHKSTTCDMNRNLEKSLMNEKGSSYSKMGSSNEENFDTSKFLMLLMQVQEMLAFLSNSLLRIQSDHWFTFGYLPKELRNVETTKIDNEEDQVSFTIQMSESNSKIIRLESAQNIFSIRSKILDFTYHGVVLLVLITFLLRLLLPIRHSSKEIQIHNTKVKRLGQASVETPQQLHFFKHNTSIPSQLQFAVPAPLHSSLLDTKRATSPQQDRANTDPYTNRKIPNFANALVPCAQRSGPLF